MTLTQEAQTRLAALALLAKAGTITPAEQSELDALIAQRDAEDKPSKEQWLKPEIVSTIEGRIVFVAPVGKDERQSITIELPDGLSSNMVIADMFDSAKDAGYSKNELPYGMTKQGLRRVQVRLHKAVVGNAKTGYNIVVPVDYTIEKKTTYWDNEANASAFHSSTGLRLGAPTITAKLTEADEETEEKQLQRIEAQTTDGKAMAIATFYSNKR